MRKQAAPAFMPDSPHGSNVPYPDPQKYAVFLNEQTYEYFFNEITRQKMRQDPQCNVEVFNRVVEAAEEQNRSHQDDETWFISEAGLNEAGLGHWKDEQDSLPNPPS